MSGEPSTNVLSVLTPPGRSAIAVVAASGSAALRAVDASFAAANRRPASEQPPDRIVFGHWSSGEHREEVVFVRSHGNTLEIHCHGGAAAVARIVDAMLAAGCRQVPWSKWITLDRVDAIAAEAEIALAQATTRRTAAILLDQRNGALAQAVNEICTAIEGSETKRAHQLLTALIDRAAIGLHLTQPWQVALAGRPNVGKSSLINALVGYQRAIVFDQPGTTRDVLTAETAIDGWPVRLADAAGIRATDDPLEAEGVARAREQLARADLVLWIIDATAIQNVEQASVRAVQELAEEAGDVASKCKPLVVLNKIDLLETARADSASNVLSVSALTGAGLDALLDAMANRLVPTPPTAGDAVPFTEQQVARLNSALTELRHGKASAAAAVLAE